MTGITVSEVFDLLKPYGVLLKAGHKGLSRLIETVSVMEVSQYQEWLHEGVLVLTALQVFETKEKVDQLIRELNEVHNCLAVHPGNKREVSFDSNSYKLADELGMPILVLPRNLPYDTVISVVLGSILNKQKIMLEKSQQINRYLTDILLAGGSFNKIAFSLKSIINQPVLIFDSDLKVIGSTFIKKLPDEMLVLEETKNILRQQTVSQQGENRTRKGKDKGNDIQTVSLDIQDQDWRLIIAVIAINNEHCGYIVTLCNQIVMEDRELVAIALTHAQTACALEMLKTKAVLAVEQKLTSDFFDDVLNERCIYEEVILQRAKNLGLDLQGKHMVAIVDIDSFSNYCLKNFKKEEPYFQEVKKRLFKITDSFVKAHYPQNLVIPKSDYLIILFYIPMQMEEKTHKTVFAQLAEELKNEINRTFNQLTVSIGIGCYFEKITGLAQSFRQARLALEIGRKLKGKNQIFDFYQLSFYCFLSQFGNVELKENCHLKLQRLLDYDRSNKSELVKTLETYLDFNENINKTAESLFMHRNSVRYRLERIKEVLGEDPFKNGEEKLSYHFAVKALKVLA